jgi:hypothetical protein
MPVSEKDTTDGLGELNMNTAPPSPSRNLQRGAAAQQRWAMTM